MMDECLKCQSGSGEWSEILKKKWIEWTNNEFNGMAQYLLKNLCEKHKPKFVKELVKVYCDHPTVAVKIKYFLLEKIKKNWSKK